MNLTESNTNTTEIPENAAVVGFMAEKRLHALVRNAEEVWLGIGPVFRMVWRLFFVFLAALSIALVNPSAEGQMEDYTSYFVCEWLREANPWC
jgi:hypothetical protein